MALNVTKWALTIIIIISHQKKIVPFLAQLSYACFSVFHTQNFWPFQCLNSGPDAVLNSFKSSSSSSPLFSVLWVTDGTDLRRFFSPKPHQSRVKTKFTPISPGLSLKESWNNLSWQHRLSSNYSFPFSVFPIRNHVSKKPPFSHRH